LKEVDKNTDGQAWAGMLDVTLPARNAITDRRAAITLANIYGDVIEFKIAFYFR
jgi:hypothetical protein